MKSILPITFDNTLLSKPKKDTQAVSPATDTHPENHDAVQLIAPNYEQYLRASMSANTVISYQADLRHFHDWGGSVPCSPHIVCVYLSTHAERYSVSTLARRIVSIKRAHTAQGLQSPTDTDLVKSTLKGIKRRHGTSQRQVEPVLKNTLVDMVMGLKGVKGIRDRTLLLMGFAGGFRRSELVGLQYPDIEFVEHGLLVHLTRSKTDQEGEGRKVAIPYARGEACPVLALRAWLQVSGITDGPLFRPITRHGRIEGSTLSTQAVAIIVKQRAAAVGLDASKFSGHSLRAGLVTSAAQAGVSAWIIKLQTGHKSDAMLNRYIRDARLFVDNAAGAIL